jgi:MFS family permease
VRAGPLLERNFRAVFIGQATSSLGNSLVPVALAFAVLELTNSATDLGLVLAAEFTAQLVLFLAGGVIADRISRRTVMLGADAVRCMSQGLLGVLLITARPSIAVIATLAAVQGLAGGIFTPAAQGLTPALVPADQLQQANTMQSMVGSTMWIIGPALGGILVATIGAGWAILADSLTYAVNVVMLARVHLVLPPRDKRTTFFSDMGTGWQEFRARSWYFSTVVTVAVMNMFASSYFVLGPEICRRYYGGAVAWGTIGAVGGIGSVLAGLWGMRLRLRHPFRFGVPLMMLFAPLPFALGARLPFVVVCVAAAVAFIGPMTFNSIVYTTVHKLVPEHLLSRLIAYDYFLAYLLLPVGTSLAGPVSNAIGLRTSMFIVAGVQLVGPLGILCLRSVRDLTDESIPESGAAADEPIKAPSPR